MRKPLRFVFLTAGLLLATMPRLGAQSVALTPADSGILGNSGGLGGWGTTITTPGWVFSVSSSVDVTALAYYFNTGNPLDGSYTVTLYHWNGAILDATLASVSISSADSTVNLSTNHNFAYESITPVTLAPGNTYVLSATGPAGGDFFYSTDNFTPASPFTFIEGLNGSTTPSGGSNSTAYFGPNLTYAAVPEPSTYALMAGVFTALAVLARKRGRRAA